MGLLQSRLVYGWDDYPEAYDFWMSQQQAHWMHTQIEMSADVNDWKTGRLNDTEKQIIGRTLKGFIQGEVLIQEYWGTKVARWFRRPSIQTMARCFAAFEGIHAVSYAYLQETLGLYDFEAFLAQPTAKARIDRMLGTKGREKADIARSLAIFSAFNEGVSLFSSFAILLSFSRRNLLKGVGEIIRYSCRDEEFHSQAGCWLFRTLAKENPEVLTWELRGDIAEAARLTVDMEDQFIDMSFGEGHLEGIDAGDLKNYIRYRTNLKLGELGLPVVYHWIDQAALERLSWFSIMSGGAGHQDFFASHSNNYMVAGADFSGMWA